jgi:DNA-binding MarR family transcriptional regulator
LTPEPFLPLLRELVRCYQAFESFSAAHIRLLGLTPPQFDIIATLGNTPGMSFKELGEKTLITKGTLTGVVERLARRRLVRRVASESDRRSAIVQLTPSGEALFERVFPEHLAHLALAFGALSRAELESTERALRELRQALAAGRARHARAQAAPARRRAGERQEARH